MLDLEQAPAIGMARDRRHLHALAGQRVGHVDVLPVGDRHPVAEMTDMLDDELLGISHGARRGRIRYCRRRR